MKKTILILTMLLMFTVVVQSQTYPILDTIITINPNTVFLDSSFTGLDSINTIERVVESGTDMRFILEYFDGDVDNGILATQSIYKVNELVYLTTTRITQHPDSGYIITPLIYVGPEPDPFDVNRDGSVNFGDLFALTRNLFGFGK